MSIPITDTSVAALTLVGYQINRYWSTDATTPAAWSYADTSEEIAAKVPAYLEEVARLGGRVEIVPIMQSAELASEESAS